MEKKKEEKNKNLFNLKDEKSLMRNELYNNEKYRAIKINWL
jgi:hypothetical protein